MSDNMSLVAHVRRTEKGLTKMQIQAPHQHASRYGRAEQASGHQSVGSCAVGPGSLPGRQRGTGGSTGRPRGDRRGPARGGPPR